MKRLAIILGFPYLVPATITLCVEHLWAFANDTDGGQITMSGGKIPDYYIVLPLALVIQILVGIPGSLMISKTSSRPSAMSCAALLPILPLVVFSTNGAAPLGLILSLLGIVGIFGIGSGFSFYFLHHRRMRDVEQARRSDSL